MTKSTSPEAVSSVVKVFTILEALGQQKAIGVTELSQRLMTSKATTYRFLQTMKSLGYVDQEGEADKYSLTLKMFELGSRSLEYVDVVALADKQMQYISEQTNETVHLGVLDDHSIMYIHKIDSSYSLRMHSRIGRRNPIYTTGIGKILLSDHSEESIRHLFSDIKFEKSTPRTLENIEQFLDEIETVKQQHYAEDNEEQEPGLYCIAVPVYNRFGSIVYGLSISFPTMRFDQKRKSYYVRLLQNAGKKISEQLGCADYPV
jgi:IclR family KDG regulon transcriptional repressor